MAGSKYLPNWSLFKLHHYEPYDFVTTQWQRDPTKVNGWYFLYRMVMAIFILPSYILYYFSLPHNMREYFAIYLTRWFVTLVVVFQLADAVLLAIESGKDLKQSKMTFFHQLSWALATITIPLGLYVTLFYWSFVYTHDTVDHPIDYFNVFSHILCTLVMFSELFTMRAPFRWHHVYLPLLVGVIYVIFTIIYFFSGGTDQFGATTIYSVLDWGNEPLKAVGLSFLSILVVIFFHMVSFGLYKLRVYIYNKTLGKEVR